MDISNDLNPTVGSASGNDLNGIELEADEKSKQKSKLKLIPSSDLDKMIADSLKEVGSDDDEVEVDDDPELLRELENIAGDGVELEEQISFKTTTNVSDDNTECQLFMSTTTTDTVTIIRLKIEMYEQALANAKAVDDGARVRRLGRGLKTLNDLLKQSLSGKSINVNDIPSEVSVKTTLKSSLEDSTKTTEAHR